MCVLDVTPSLQRESRKVYGVNMDTDVNTEPEGEEFVLKDSCSFSSSDTLSDVEFTEGATTREELCWFQGGSMRE